MECPSLCLVLANDYTHSKMNVTNPQPVFQKFASLRVPVNEHRSKVSALSNLTVYRKLIQDCQPEGSANYISLSKDLFLWSGKYVCFL